MRQNATFELNPHDEELPRSYLAAKTHRDAAVKWAAYHDGRWDQTIGVDVVAIGTGVKRSYNLTATVKWSATVKR